MKRIYQWGFVSALLMLLTACGGLYETVYTYQAPETQRGRACVIQCQQSRDVCQRMCGNRHSGCEKEAYAHAKMRYTEYQAAQQKAGHAVEREMESFLDLSGCKKQDACACEADYRACFELCGGQLIPQKRCIAKCGQ